MTTRPITKLVICNPQSLSWLEMASNTEASGRRLQELLRRWCAEGIGGGLTIQRWHYAAKRDGTHELVSVESAPEFLRH